MKDIELNKKQGLRLKECRTNAHLTQQELSDSSNFSKQHISYIECGKRGMSYEAASTFAKILSVRKEYLLCEDDYKDDAEEQKDSLDWRCEIENTLHAFLVQLGRYVEKRATYKNLETDELIVVDDKHGFPEPPPGYHNELLCRELDNNIVCEYDDEVFSLKREDFETLIKPLYKRISETFIIHDYPAEIEIELTKEQWDSFVDEIVDFTEFIVNRFD